VRRPTTYDVTSADKVIVFLASLDLGSGCSYGKAAPLL